MNAYFKFECPHCTQHISAEPEAAGTVGLCPTCEGEFTVPAPASEELAEPASVPVVPPPLPSSSKGSEPASPSVLSPPKKGFFTGCGSLLAAALGAMAAQYFVQEMFGPEKPRSDFEVQMDKLRSGGTEKVFNDFRDGKYGAIPQPGVDYKTRETSDPNSAEASTSGWQRREVAGVTLDLPGVPRIKSFTVPDAVKAVIEKNETYELKAGEATIVVTHARYVATIASLDGAVSGSIEGMRKQPGTSDFSSDVTIVSLDGIPARRSIVRFRRSEYELAFHIFAVARDRDLWIIIVGAPSAKTPDIADRVFASAHLSP